MTETAFEGLSYVESIPLQFTPAGDPPTPAGLARINAENVQLLLADASLDDTYRGPESKEDDGPSAAELQRIEFKLNVLLQLVAGLLSRAGDHPRPVPARIFGDGIAFRPEGPPPAVGSLGIVHVYLSRGLPKPLELPGRVIGIHVADGAEWTRFQFEGLTSQVTSLLERLIFRHHRRQVAEARGTAR